MKLRLIILITLTCTSLLADEVSISVGDQKLHGDLDIFGKERSQVVFFISGSGLTDRDGNSAGLGGKNNCLKYLGDALNKESVTTLRVDKRGVGASVGAATKEADLRFETYVDDTKQWITFLEGKGYSEIILVGHSEGALVATLASSTKPVMGLVCIVGAGRSAGDVLREQLKPKLPEKLYDQADKVVSALAEGKRVDDLPTPLNSLFRPSAQPYLSSWFKIDPAQSISKVQVPILIIQGSTDLQTTIKDAELLHKNAAGSKLIKIEGMNHVLKTVGGDLAAQMPSYANPDLPLHKDLGRYILEFIRTTKKK